MNKLIIGVLIGVVLGGTVTMIGIKNSVSVTGHPQMGMEMLTDEMMGQHDGHTHEQIMVANNATAPALTLTAVPDSKDGYNLYLETSNFTFTPEMVGEEVVQNTGHAHVYVGERKIARVYGNWFHLSAAELSTGDNLIMVSLNANDHREWTNDGVSVTDTITLRGE